MQRMSEQIINKLTNNKKIKIMKMKIIVDIWSLYNDV